MLELDIKNILIGVLGLISTINEILPFIDKIEANGILHYFYIRGKNSKQIILDEEIGNINEDETTPLINSNEIEEQPVNEITSLINSNVIEEQPPVNEITHGSLNKTHHEITSDSLIKLIEENEIMNDNEFSNLKIHINKLKNKDTKQLKRIQETQKKYLNKFLAIEDNFNVFDKSLLVIEQDLNLFEEKVNNFESKLNLIENRLSVFDNKVNQIANKHDNEIDGIHETIEFYNIQFENINKRIM